MMGAGTGPRPLERIGQEGVVYYAQKQTDRWPNDNATDRACIDNADARVAYDANGWMGPKQNQQGQTESELRRLE